MLTDGGGESMSDTVWVRIEPVPVLIRSSTGVTHCAKVPMEKDITASEDFPATQDAAKYRLSLSKEVLHSSEVLKVKDELLAALNDLKLVWTFAGGSQMVLESHTPHNVPLYSTNAHDLLKELSEREGYTRLANTLSFPIEVTATYTDFPLRLASDLVTASKSDFHLRLMFEYYDAAQRDNRAWFVHLYKIRDSLRNAARFRGIKRQRFGIDKARWNEFGRLLNTVYDLRHAPKRHTGHTDIRPAERSFVFKLGREMIARYMDFWKIKHVP